MSVRRAEGKISAVDTAKMQAKCTFPGISDVESDWMQILVHGPGVEERCFPIDTLVACMMDDNYEDGWILGRIYPDTQDIDGATEKKWKRTFSDGTTIEIDEDTHAIKLTGKGAIDIDTTGNVTVKTTGKATVQAATIDLDGGGGVIGGVVHQLSPCPYFGGSHLCPSNTVKASG